MDNRTGKEALVEPRLNRLFAADGNCFKIALDHAFFNEYELLEGVRDIDSLIDLVIDTGKVDAMLLSFGNARRLQSRRGAAKPALVVRADVSNLYAPKKPTFVYSRYLKDAVERALRLDAAAVLFNFFFVQEDPTIHDQCIRNICEARAECERYGMPLIAEPLVLELDQKTGRYALSDDPKLLLPLHRQAAELGVDVIKADPIDSIESFAEAVELTRGIPLLPRGGSKVGAEEILKRTYRMLQAGARGVVYGRNIFQSPDVLAMIDTVHGLVHEQWTLEQSLARLR